MNIIHPLKMILPIMLILFSASLFGEEPDTSDFAMTIPFFDLSQETHRQIVVEPGTEEVYQGHPTTVLLPDGKTMYAVWTLNHGGPCGPMKKSDDGGKTWGKLIDTPASWKTVSNCPAIYRLIDPNGKARLFVFACNKGSMVRSVSEDDGVTWSEMERMEKNIEKLVMPWCTIIPVDGEKRYLAGTNCRRPGDPDKLSNHVVGAFTDDGGLTWGEPFVLCDIPGQKPCEPCFIRSPDGRRIACVMRENVRTLNSHVVFSDDEGKTWTKPKMLPGGPSGDRHQAVYAKDGRLVLVFRDMAVGSMTRGHFVAWVGTFDDLVKGTEGRYRIKLLHSNAGSDCGYPGLELLPDGTFVATTYVKYRPGKVKHSVVSVRFRLDEIDERLKRSFVRFR